MEVKADSLRVVDIIGRKGVTKVQERFFNPPEVPQVLVAILQKLAGQAIAKFEEQGKSKKGGQAKISQDNQKPGPDKPAAWVWLYKAVFEDTNTRCRWYQGGLEQGSNPIPKFVAFNRSKG